MKFIDDDNKSMFIAWWISMAIVITLFCLSNAPKSTPVTIPTPRPTDLTCVGIDGHYRPADGRNYVILNDEWCQK